MAHKSNDPDSHATAPTIGADDPEGAASPSRTDASASFPLLDRYEDLGAIGAGGMGEVRRVHDRLMGRALAMKILSWRLAASAEARDRFLHEARVTSNLQHPGIVAVHDVGVLPDGRPWYTMKEVRGRTLRTILEQLHGEPPEHATKQLEKVVEALMRACDAMAYAHSRGVIHRDLKPDNLMVGRFGEVQVMDWGLALELDELLAIERPARSSGVEVLVPEDTDDAFMSVALAHTVHGAAADSDKISGTFAYMSPEQARGESLGPASDVYALGAVLYETAAGRAPYSGKARKIWLDLLSGPPLSLSEWPSSPLRPPDLCAIAERAMHREALERYADAGELAKALRQWLDNRRHHARAMGILHRADQLWPRIASLRAEARRLHAKATEQLENVKSYDPPQLKYPAWHLQEQAAKHARDAAVEEVAWQQLVQSALNEVPDLDAAHLRLASHYRRRLEVAEAARDREGAARAEALLRTHDRGEHAAYLRGDSKLTLLTDPPDALLSLYRYRLINRKLEAEHIADLGTAPLSEHVLPWGSYLIIARAPGRHEVRYPVFLPRGGAWAGIRPGDDAPTPIWLPPLGELAEGDVYIPAGWFLSGGDPTAIEPLPRRRVWVDAFVMRRHPVTRAEYLAYLNTLVAEGREEEALRRAPKKALGDESERSDEPQWPRGVDGRYRLDPGFADPEQGSWPVSLIDWYDACAYARWLNAGRDTGWRLPSELEWEKAARGVDGRFLPWGDYFEPTFACVVGSHNEALHPYPIDAFPDDVSTHGVWGLAGNVRDWCLERWEHDGPSVKDGLLKLSPATAEDDAFRAVRGGAWTSVVERAQLASRFAVKPRDRYRGVGMRLARSVAQTP